MFYCIVLLVSLHWAAKSLYVNWGDSGSWHYAGSAGPVGGVMPRVGSIHHQQAAASR